MTESNCGGLTGTVTITTVDNTTLWPNSSVYLGYGAIGIGTGLAYGGASWFPPGIGTAPAPWIQPHQPGPEEYLVTQPDYGAAPLKPAPKRPRRKRQAKPEELVLPVETERQITLE